MMVPLKKEVTAKAEYCCDERIVSIEVVLAKDGSAVTHQGDIAIV